MLLCHLLLSPLHLMSFPALICFHQLIQASFLQGSVEISIKYMVLSLNFITSKTHADHFVTGCLPSWFSACSLLTTQQLLLKTPSIFFLLVLPPSTVEGKEQFWAGTALSSSAEQRTILNLKLRLSCLLTLGALQLKVTQLVTLKFLRHLKVILLHMHRSISVLEAWAA